MNSSYFYVDVLVAPKRIVKRVSDLTPVEVSDLFLLAQKVEELMERVHGSNSSTLTIQDGAEAGQTVEVGVVFFYRSYTFLRSHLTTCFFLV
jgi:diadenosine tetraphosphate (Ap4A) HIT family hydrolase